MNLIENIKLNEEEQRTYAELFKACDVENYGKVSGNIAYNLFLTAGLSQETLTQVATLCGSRGLGHLGRAEFYVAVKLIAAAQCGFPVVVESLGAEVPLPKFHQFTGYERNQAGYFHPQMSDVTAEQDRNRMVNQQAMSSNIMMQAYPQQQQQPQASSTMPQQQAPQQTMTHQQQAAQQPPQQQTMPQQTMPQQPQQVMSHQNAMPHPQQMQHQNAQQMVHQNSLQQPQQQQPQPPQQQHQAAMPQQPQMPPHSAMVTQQQQHAATTQQHVLPSQMSVGGIGLPPPPHAKQRSTAATAASGAAHLVRNQSVDQQQQVYPGSSGGGGGSGGSEDPTVSPPTFSPRHTPPPPMSPDAASRTAPAMPDYPANHPAGSHGALRAQPSIDSTGTNAQQYATQQGFQTYEPQQQQPQQQPHAPKIEKPWTSFDDDDDDKGLITEESTQWANFPDTSRAPDTLSISSEAESLDDVWSITEEQREYYLQQFQKMQKDLTSVISGPVAKQFFEKSKLPVAELSKIWYLSDMDRDGALSLEEFCTAMHLVVLRRNDIELPDDLPPALMPYSIVTNTEEPFASDLPQSQQLNLAPSEGADSPGASGAAVVKHVDSPTSPSNTTQWTATFPPSSASSSAGGGAGGGVGAAVSPSSSSVSSPGSRPAPANFEFKPITADSDSTIIHPVALRMSPDGQPITVGNDPLDQRHVHLNNGEGNSMTSSYMHRYGSSADHDGGGGGGSSTRIPHHSGGPPGGAGSGLSAGHHEVETTDTLIDLSNGASATTASTAATESTRDLPPAVPQRKNTPEMMLDTDTHHPSATTMQHTTSGAPPPHTRQHHFSAVDGASGNFADFSRFESIPSQEVLHTPAAAPTDHHHPPPRDHLLRVVTDRGGGGPPHGATAADANMPEKHRRSVSIDYKQFSTSSFGTSKEATQQDIDALYASAGAGAEILQKLSSQTSSEADQAAQPPQLLMRQASRDRKDFHSAIRKQKERNTMLSRLNSELNQELQEVMEQRIALEIQLEHLRPFSS